MKCTPLVLSLAAFALFAGSANALQGAVIVVDWQGGGDFTQLQPAIDAASDGDVLLIKSGGYSGFVLDGKSLVLQGDPFARVSPIEGGSIVRNVSGEVVLRNLEFGTTGAFPQKNLTILENSGSVLLDACQFRSGIPGLRVVNSAAVTFVECVVEGYDWFPGIGAFEDTREALRIDNATVFAYDSFFQGGAGLDNPWSSPPTRGADAVFLEGGLFLAEACVLTGGRGGDGGPAWGGGCHAGKDGGSAVALVDGNPTAYITASSLSGGPGGVGHFFCLPGNAGDKVHVAAGTHVDLGGWPRFLRLDSPVRAGSSMDVDFVSRAGDHIYLLVSSGQFPLLLPELLGSLLADPGGTLLYLGPIWHPSGFRRITLPTGPLPPGIQGIGLYLQPGFVSLSAPFEAALGPPRYLLLLDPAL